MTTNVPLITVTDAGLSIPLEAEVLDGILSDFDDAFGGNLNKNLETPQGQLASSLTAIVADKNNEFAELTNNFDPTYATGIWQDALAKIYFITRKPATSSTVYCDLIGLSGVVVDAGFAVKDANGIMWTLNQSVTIGASGTVQGLFTCAQVGAVTAPAGTITSIYQAVVGLDRVSNAQDATVGSDLETRAEFEARRAKSVALNTHGTPQSVYAEMMNLTGVTDCFVWDNVLDTSVNYGSTNTSILPHSIYVSVLGGVDADIADAILRKTGNGCNYNGNTHVTVYDTTYSNPQPQYTVSFMRPAPMPVYFSVRVESANAPNNINSLVQTAIKKCFSSTSDIRPSIGSHIHAMKFVSAINSAIGNAHLLSVQVGASAGSMGATLVTGVDQYPTIADANITVTLV